MTHKMLALLLAGLLAVGPTAAYAQEADTEAPTESVVTETEETEEPEEPNVEDTESTEPTVPSENEETTVEDETTESETNEPVEENKEDEETPSEAPDEEEEPEENSEEEVPAYSVARLAGKDRYETSRLINQAIEVSSDVVVVASGENFADALMAQNLLREFSAKIYLTSKNHLSIDTINQISKDGAKKILIVGGEASVSKEVEKELSKLAEVERLAGANRYKTADAINEKLKGPFSVISYVSGEEYADALSAAPFVRQENSKMLLTDSKTDVKGFDVKTYILGGETRVKTTNDLERISGVNRYHTSLKLAKRIKDADTIYLVTGRVYADSLSLGSILMNTETVPNLLLVDGSRPLAEEQVDFLSRYTNLVIVGGEASISKDVEEQLVEIAKGNVADAKLREVRHDAKKELIKAGILDDEALNAVDKLETVDEITEYVENMVEEHNVATAKDKAKETLLSHGLEEDAIVSDLEELKTVEEVETYVENALEAKALADAKEEAKDKMAELGLDEEEALAEIDGLSTVDEVKAYMDGVLETHEANVLAAAKEEGIAKLEEAGVTDENIIALINAATSADVVDAFVDYFLTEHENGTNNPEEDPALLEEAKDAGRAKLEEASVTQAIFYNILDRIQTVEGVENYVTILLEEYASVGPADPAVDPEDPTDPTDPTDPVEPVDPPVDPAQ